MVSMIIYPLLLLFVFVHGIGYLSNFSLTICIYILFFYINDHPKALLRTDFGTALQLPISKMICMHLYYP